ncbi:MAG TPA: response regulator [Streptosporangiales bacterium]
MPQTILAVATLLWPLIVVVVLVVFGRSLLRLLSSAERRGLTVKFGGYEISLRELGEQQWSAVDDLRRQLSALEGRVDRLAPDTSKPARREESVAGLDVERPPLGGTGVLWVDDEPKNNALEIERLERSGVGVKTVKSTEEAMLALSHHRFTLIISDMTRQEAGRLVADAGVQLIRHVRADDAETPIVIYAGRTGIQRYGSAAREAGANLVTASAYELSRKLRQLGLQ